MRRSKFVCFFLALDLLMAVIPHLPVHAADAVLSPTLSLKQVSGPAGETVWTAWQSKMPVPSFEPQRRPRLDLAGTWKKERDDFDIAVTMGVRDAQGIAALEKEAAGRPSLALDDSGWKDKSLPMVENTMPPEPENRGGAEMYESGVWYRRHFTPDAAWKDQRVTLNFLGANYITDIWINGTWIGYHEGGYTPFAFDVSSALHYGEDNLIVLRIDNPAWGSRSDIIPAQKSDWWNYAGLIQDVYLEAAPPLWIVRADIRTPDLSGKVYVTGLVHNASKTALSGAVTLQIFDTDRTAASWLDDPHADSITKTPVGKPITVNVQAVPGDVSVFSADLTIPAPVPWRPEAPALYVLKATLDSKTGMDSTAYQFGVRTLGTDSYKLLLDDKPYFLMGIARHEDWPDSGRTATWDKIRADLLQIKSLHANFVRTAHYPNHIYTYLLTDRIGLAAAVEIPLWQFTPEEFQAQATRQLADQMWREMIFSNSNRPSIILWSTNNESKDSPERSAYVLRLVSDYHDHYTDGRLVTQSAAADRGGPGDVSQVYNDVAGWTMYFGIFHGSTYYDGTAAFLKKAHEAYPNKPVLNTEFGIWSLGGNSYPGRQVIVFNDTFRALSEVSARKPDGGYNPDGFVAGLTWWAAFDWYSPISKLQTMGLYEMDRQTVKPVADTLAQAYKTMAQPAE